MSGSGSDGDDKGGEKRVKELVQPKGTEKGAPLDEETIAQIVHWFGMPALDMALAKVPPSEHEGETPGQRITRRREEAMAHVQPRMVAQMQRHTSNAERLQKQPMESRPWERPELTTFRATMMPNFPADDEWPQVRISDDLLRFLDQRAPQAMLRDLHRPETYFERRFQPPWDDVFQPPDLDPFAAAREELAKDHRCREVIPAALDTIREAIGNLRSILAGPWEEGKREKARAREPELLARWEEARSRATAAAESPQPGGKHPGGRPVRRSPEKSP